jgi:hypothetical protein
MANGTYNTTDQVDLDAILDTNYLFDITLDISTLFDCLFVTVVIVYGVYSIEELIDSYSIIELSQNEQFSLFPDDLYMVIEMSSQDEQISLFPDDLYVVEEMS